MPATKAKPRKTKQSKKATVDNENAQGGVLTLAETATFLRVSKADVLKAVRSQCLPARKVRDEWRFSLEAIRQWLSSPVGVPSPQEFWSTHFGALKNDPYLAEMLEDIYRRRGRPETEVRELGRLARLLTTDH